MKAGTAFALGRMSANIHGEDVERVLGVSRDEMRRYGLGRVDTLLHSIGLRREAETPNRALWLLGGVALGAAIGGGVVFFAYTERGQEMRRRMRDFVMRTRERAHERVEEMRKKGGDGPRVELEPKPAEAAH